MEHPHRRNGNWAPPLGDWRRIQEYGLSCRERQGWDITLRRSVAHTEKAHHGRSDAGIVKKDVIAPNHGSTEGHLTSLRPEPNEIRI